LVDVYIATGKPEQAIALLQQELKQSNGSARIRGALATMAAASGHDDVAIKQFEEMLSSNPNSPEVLMQLARLYKRNGQTQQATASVERASQVAPQNAKIQAVMGQSLEESGRRSEAIAKYRKALELSPQDPVVMNNLAMLLADDPKQLEEALKLASAARQKAPAQPSIADTIGWIYYKKDMYDSALQIFSNLAQRYPDNGNFRYHHGATLLAKGDKSKAKQELQSALEKNLSQGDRQAVTELLKKI
jgi:Flp pilus assembly protein TadD